MPLRLFICIGAVALLTWPAHGQDDPEGACTAERLDYYDDAVAARDLDAQDRRRLIDRGAALLRRWQRAAPRCAGRLHEARAFVLTTDSRYADELVRDVQAYLDGPGQRAETRTKIILGHYLALGLSDLGRTRDAARAYDEAAGYADAADARFGVSALIEAASMARSLGDAPTARAYLDAALTVLADSAATERLDGSDYSLAGATGQAYVNLAMLHESQLETAVSEAERDSLVVEMERATASALATLGNERWDAGLRSIALNLSALALATMGRFDQAEARIAPSAALAREAGVYRPTALFTTHLTTGKIRALAGDADGARAAFRRARAEAIRLGDTHNEAVALGVLGRLAEREGDWGAAARLYQAAIEKHESFRDRVGLEDWSTLAFAAVQAPYRGLVRTRLAQGRATDAFATLDQTRARYLRDLRDHLAIRRRMTPRRRARVDSLADALGALRAELADATGAPARARLRKQISALQGTIEAVTAVPRTPLEPLALGPLQRSLAAERRTLVSYFIDVDASYAFVVRPDTVLAIRLEATPFDIREALRDTGTPWRDGTADPAFDLAALHRLYTLLVAPIAAHVPTSRVVIVPDVEVATVPFAMLTRAPAERYEDAPYLLRDWTVSTELTAAFADGDARPDGAAISVLAFGRSDFSSDRAENGRSTWNDLAHVVREVERVGGYDGSRAFLGDGATEAQFAALAGTARVIHLASHASADPALPLYSQIQLRGDRTHDGTLYLYEVLELPLVADLVVLSGCSTADGGRRDGEGLIGLQFGMRAAGAASTLATLWPVADDATAELMDGFYEALADGLDKDHALRQAQLAYLGDHEGLAASPFYWAAPVLSGSPAPVPLGRLFPWARLLLGVAILAALAWAVHRHRARA